MLKSPWAVILAAGENIGASGGSPERDGRSNLNGRRQLDTEVSLLRSAFNRARTLAFAEQIRFVVGG